jgi:hypothetical protein
LFGVESPVSDERVALRAISLSQLVRARAAEA